ncbi:XRE family transcriptional regulator [Alistipes shahii]|jgi:phage repressor protein C with HTH and peptisase S24 domain
MQKKEHKNTEISERISKLIEALGIKPNAFALALGYNRSQTIYDIVKGKSAPSFDFFNKLAMSEYSEILNMDWVLTGRGEILLSKTPEKPYKENVGKFVGENVGFPKLRKSHTNPEYPTGEESFEKNVADVVVDKVFKLRTDRLIDRQQIPIYDMEAVAGLVPLFADQYSQSIVEVMETTLIPKCDGGLRIVGDSMYPLLKSGDIVFYKQVHDIMHSIIWGEMYLISFDIDGDEYVSVKYLQKSDIPDHIVLVSYNEHHKPMEIHINRIRALAFIKASLRLNSLK